MAQDHQGFLWFATLDGLNRYDGYNFKIFRNDPDDRNSLSNNNLWSLLADRSGVLWVGTTGGGLDRFDPRSERFTHHRHDASDPQSLSHNTVWAIHEDRSGAIWVGTGGGLNRLDPQTGKFTRYPHDRGAQDGPGRDIRAIHQDREGDLWIGTYGDGLSRLNLTTQRFTHYAHDPNDAGSLSLDEVWGIYEDRSGVLWISTYGGGLNRFDSSTERFTRYAHDPNDPHSLSHDNVKAVHEDRSGVLWVSTNGGGLNRFDVASGRFTSFQHDPANSHSLSHNNVWTLLEDRTGILWIGTNGGGLNRFNPATERFKGFRHDPGDPFSLSDNNVRALCEDAAGMVWVGTNGKGLNRFEPATGRSTRYRHDPNDPSSLSADNVWVTYEDRAGVIWIGTNGGLNRWNATDDRFERYTHGPGDPFSLSHDKVWTIAQSHDGALWIGTDGGGVNRFDPETERFTHYRHAAADPHSLSSDFVSILHEDREGTLWVGTGGSGLNRFDSQTQRFTRYARDATAPGGPSSDIILSLLNDANGVLWIGTDGGGLNRFDPAAQSFRVYRRKDGLPNDTVYGILEDNRGQLWLSTNYGLARFDPRTETFRNYDTGHGLLGNEFNAGAYVESRTGQFYLGGIDGLTAFHPDHLETNPHVPPVVLTSFKKYHREAVLESPIPYSSALVLSYQDDLISFEVAALDFSASKNNQYAYRLDDLNADWIALGTKREITFTDLDAGRYTLRVKGSNNDGVWNEGGMALPITVLPPPWATWWAYSFYALAVAAAVAGTFRSYRKKLWREQQISQRLRQVDRLKDEFLANTSHELRTPLYGITGLAESLIDGARGHLPEAVQADLSMVAASGRRLSHLVNDILDFSKLRHKNLELRRAPVDLKAIAEVVLTLARPLVGTKDLELINAVPADLPAADADEDRLQQILHNLVGNAIKFTESGRVEVSASVRDSMLDVQVADTGIGIPEAHQERIFDAFEQADASVEREYGGTGLGLAVTRQLVEHHGGTISLASTVGVGSTFAFSLPTAAEPALRAPAEVGSTATSRSSDARSLNLEEADGLAGPAIGSQLTDLIQAPEGSLHILIVDDEPIIRQVLANQLGAQGFRTTPAGSGAEALRLLAERTFDLVILDVMMPRMSGFEVCRKLRERHSLDELPVIFLTAKNLPEDLVVGLAAGANDYLPKPVSKRELLARVQTHVALLQVNRRLNDLVAERTLQLAERERLLDQLEETNTQLARFNYTVAHDLKNPLTTIMNFVGLAQQDAAEGHIERLLNDFARLDAAATKLGRMFDELYELSRIGVHSNPFEVMAFGELVEEALAELAEPIAKRRVAFEVAPDLPSVTGDRGLLLEAVRHLLANGIQYLGDQTSPKIEVGVRSTESASGERVAFYVRDNGIGIEPQYHQKIFELFQRLDPETSEGTGIGLALVKRIVEFHGGRIWVESEGRGHGSTFCFYLRADPAPSPRITHSG